MTFPLDKFAKLPTPFYCYDLGLLSRTLQAVNDAIATHPNYHVHYAVKANSDPELLKHIFGAGLGADTVSGGEINIALRAGVAPEDIVFAGVGKTDRDIAIGINAGIGTFNIESIQELDIINDIAGKLGRKASVALRINPDIDAHTHHFITTGIAENKFGIDMRDLDRAIDHAVALENIELTGLHFHIGSQITIAEPFKLLCHRVNDIVASLAARGIALRNINLGGGLGIDYDHPEQNPIPDFSIFFDTIKSNLELPENIQIHFELGRSIVGQCGTLIGRVLYVKNGHTRDFAIIDAGMTELIRPALYEAYHFIANLTGDSLNRPQGVYDVVGPVCESTDTFGHDRTLSQTQRGDIIAIYSAGAYGQAMSSNYNARHLCPNFYLK